MPLTRQLDRHRAVWASFRLMDKRNKNDTGRRVERKIEREQRLAAALRDNLRKRKALARARRHDEAKSDLDLATTPVKVP